MDKNQEEKEDRKQELSFGFHGGMRTQGKCLELDACFGEKLVGYLKELQRIQKSVRGGISEE